MTENRFAHIDFAADQECSRRIREYLAQIVDAICELVGENLKALVLTGAMPTGEASAFINDEGNLVLLSDFDFLAVTHSPVRAERNRELSSAIKSRFSDQSKQMSDIGLSFTTTENLRALPFCVSVYTTRNTGLVVYGEEDVLNRIPDFSPSEIPKLDPIIYTQNRSIEELFSRDAIEGKAPLTMDVFFHTVYHSAKTIIDLNQSLLAFLERHKKTYRDRLEELRTIWESDKIEILRAQIPNFLNDVSFWTEFKLHPAPKMLSDKFAVHDGDEESMRQCMETVWKTAQRYSFAIWRYQWASFRGLDDYEEIKAVDFTRRLIGSEILPHRLVRWAKFLKRKETDREIISYPRLARLALLASPRLLFYLSSMLLYFSYCPDETGVDENEALGFFRKYFPLKITAPRRTFPADKEQREYFRQLSVYMMKKVIAKEDSSLNNITTPPV